MRVGDRDVVVSHDMYWSAERLQDPEDGTLLLRSVALTPTPARVGARPVVFLDGALDHRGCTSRWRLDTTAKSLLERAASAYVPRRFDHRTPLRIRNLDGTDPETAVDFWEHGAARHHRPEAPAAGAKPTGPMRGRGQLGVGAARQLETRLPPRPSRGASAASTKKKSRLDSTEPREQYFFVANFFDAAARNEAHNSTVPFSPRERVICGGESGAMARTALYCSRAAGRIRASRARQARSCGYVLGRGD